MIISDSYIVRVCIMALGVLLLSLGDEAQTTRNVGSVKGPITIKQQLADLATVDVVDEAKFLNDLKLSPFWSVVKDRSGKFSAQARGFSLGDFFFDDAEGLFLFELPLKREDKLPNKWVIGNSGIHDEKYSILYGEIVFEKPDESKVDLLGEDGKASLVIHPQGSLLNPNSDIDGNANSMLGVKLSSKHSIYLMIREQGDDANRKLTFAKVKPLLSELSTVAKLPEKYMAKEQYAAFYQKFFPEAPKDVILKRLPWMQDRDTFYGYFRSKPDVSYERINIKVSHPIYAKGEATRESSRLAKAEYLGKPYRDDDRLFFLIEDNAVYLLPEYDKQFGTFSGDKIFQGIMEILNADNKVLHKCEEPFKGWER